MSARKTTAPSPLLAALIRIVVAVGARLPLRFLRALGSIAGAVVARFPFSPTKVTELNLRLGLPELGPRERRRLVRESLRQSAMTAFELPAVWGWSPEKLIRLEEDVVGEEALRRAIASGRGTLLLAPHTGNWEMLNHFLMRRGQLVVLYRPPRIAELDGFLRRVRERTGCRMVAASPAGLRPLLRALRANHLVMVLPDQEPLKAHGVHAPFFGVPALTMTLVSRLLARTGATALLVHAERRPSGRFRFYFRETSDRLDGDDPRASAAALNREIETSVRRRPEQYLWSYKRFLTAPPGEPTPYRAIWSRRRLKKNPFPKDRGDRLVESSRNE